MLVSSRTAFLPRIGLVPVVAATMILVLWPGVSRAWALAWPLDAPTQVALAFGARYGSANEAGSTHRGVDLRAEAGDAVLSPCSGEMTFVGRVPAVGSAGTVLACTIERGDGVRFTLMPLESVSLATGQQVESGSRIAEVAARGDSSSAVTHLHVGVRRGDLYVDPLGVLIAPVATPQPAPETQPSHSPAAEAPAAAVVAPTPAVVPANAGLPEARASAPSEPAAEPAGEADPASSPQAQPAASPAAPPEVLTSSEPARVSPGAQSVSLNQSGAFGGGSVSVGSAAHGPALAAPTQSGVHSLDLMRPTVASSPDPRTVAAVGESTSGRAASSLGPVSVGPVAQSSASKASGSLASLLSSIAGRGAPIAGRSASRLGRAWLAALVALLAATGALWPLWRRESDVGELEVCLAPVGGEVAAAAGR